MTPSSGGQLSLVRRLTIDDLGDALALQRIVGDGLPAGYLFPKTDAELSAYLDGSRGAAWGIGPAGGLRAVALLRLPAPDQSFSGPPFPLVPADEIGLSCFLENTIVHPEERRRGHHRTLLDARISAADAMGKRWVCAGVHLENRRSWSNLLAAGLAIVGMRRDFGYPVIGLLRPADRDVLATDAGSDRPVAVAEVEAHDAALREGWVGLRLLPDGRVLYRRLTSRGGA